MDVELFHIIDDGVAILRVKGGIERQAKIYQRQGKVYAGVGGGYLRLTAGGGTASPNVSCIDVGGPGISFGHNRLPKFEAAEPVKA